MIEIRGIKLEVSHSQVELEREICKRLKIKQLPDYEILKRSIDARKKPDVFFVYHIGVHSPHEKELLKKVNDKNIMLTNRVTYDFPQNGKLPLPHHPLIIGAGPSGLFCGFILAKAGFAPVIVERGEQVEEREKIVEAFFQNNCLNPECNIQFGEGGAGTFSDGKLNTQVKDKYGRIRFVLETFVRHGANPDILFDYKPHVGTDVLKKVIQGIRMEIEALGGTFLFHTKAVDFKIEDGTIKKVKLSQNGIETWVEGNPVILAIGHSARDTFSTLYEKKIPMEAKEFAMGVRVEHPASWIQEASYGNGKAAKILPAAPYKLTHQTTDQRGVYSFCMCPGGYVVNASSQPQRIAVNGMSYSDRGGNNSNSAIVVSVKKSDFKSNHPLAGVYFQQELEEAVFREGKGRVVAQRYGDFCQKKVTKKFETIVPQIKGGYSMGDLNQCLPDFIINGIKESMPVFGKKIKNFDHEDAVLSGVESRTSSPIRIIRDENFCSEIKGIYPCGEGAGYAGGIMSAAMDGMKVAEAIIKKYTPKK